MYKVCGHTEETWAIDRNELQYARIFDSSVAYARTGYTEGKDVRLES